jgi:hypothetical protein
MGIEKEKKSKTGSEEKEPRKKKAKRLLSRPGSRRKKGDQFSHMDQAESSYMTKA